MIFKTVIKGSFFTAETDQKVVFQRDRLIGIGTNGTIANIFAKTDVDYDSVLEQARQAGRLIELPANQYILPGFIDLHIHAPQWPQAGLALDKPLYEWLNQYTFPLEAKYQDEQFAQKNYHSLVQNLIANGTTTALYFGTIHQAANLILAAECFKAGQRAFVGQVVMDNPDQTPEYYRNSSTQQALDATEAFIQQVQARYSTLIEPVVTPRFVPSCTDKTLRGLGKLAQQYNVLIQSHVSESDWEHDYVQHRFGKHDTEVLQQFGLLTDRSVMAHGTLLTEQDQLVFKQQNAAIAHCPISNAYFGNAVLPVRQLLKQKIKLGLGTDISGGFTPSMYRNIQQAVISARMLEDGVDARLSSEKRGVGNARITVPQAFYMATVNGAQALHIKAGQIQSGYQADLQIVTDELADLGRNEPDEVLERLIYQTSASNIAKVFISGRLVKDN